jgi:hypothetical protein
MEITAKTVKVLDEDTLKLTLVGLWAEFHNQEYLGHF